MGQEFGTGWDTWDKWDGSKMPGIGNVGTLQFHYSKYPKANRSSGTVASAGIVNAQPEVFGFLKLLKET
jgi:hypothetical protein